MDIQPQQLHSEAHPEIGAVLQRDAGLLIERWSRRAAAEQPHAARVHHDVLLDHLPAFLREMGRSLAEEDVDNNGWHCPPAGRHGEQRWESGWSLAEVVRDYQILRLVILDYLEEALDRPLRGREVMAIGLVLDESIAASVTQYGRHQKAAERARAERRRKAEERRHRREAESLKEAERHKDEFLAVLAHELRNHLAPLVNAAAILGLEGGETPTARQARETIGRQLQQMAHLVNDLLDVARLKQGKVSLQSRPVPLAAVLAQAVEAARPQLDARGHQLSASVPAEPLCVDGDPVRLTQVFVNLLTNAAKYTPPGGHVGLVAAQEGAEVVVRVRDDGVGIPKDLLGRVFDLFAQGGEAEGERGGLGVGLALVKSLVELHGGAVEAHSDGAGRGCEFVVRLPAARERQPGSAPGAVGDAGNPAALRRRVLVVDDKRDSADSLGALLGLLGHVVRTAYDGPQALDAAREFRPQVILLDIGLPTLGGHEVARRLREDPDLKGVTLVALSGYGSEEDRRRSREAGFDHYLIKPCVLEDLEAVLRKSPAQPQ